MAAEVALAEALAKLDAPNPAPRATEAPSELPVSESTEEKANSPTAEVKPATPQPATRQTTSIASSNDTEATKSELVSQEETTNYVRAGNDPRSNPKPVTTVSIATIETNWVRGLPLDTTKPANVARQPRPLKRAPNDPRSKVATRNNATEAIESKA